MCVLHVRAWVQSSRRLRFFVPWGLHFGHPVGLPLLVRWHTIALHACLHFRHFHSALWCDDFVTEVGFLSGSTYSNKSFFPRSPFFSHHT